MVLGSNDLLDNRMLDNSNAVNNTLAGVVILAGGNSKRMGSPKAMLTLATGERLLDYHVRQAVKLNVPIMIADNERGFKVSSELIADSKANIFHIADYSQDNTTHDENDNKQTDTGGPLVAIDSALQALNHFNDKNGFAENQRAWLLVISCDSLISVIELWQYLGPFIASNNKDNKSVICLSDEQHEYPLLGIYRLDLVADLRAYIDSGQRRVIRFIEPIHQTVAFDKRWRYLTNFNTPKDFKKACAALASN